MKAMDKVLILLMVSFVLVSSGSLWGQEDVKAKPIKDENRVIVSYGDKSLTALGARALEEYRFGRGLVDTSKFWLDMQINAEEARKRGMDKGPKAEFIAKFLEVYMLAGMLAREINREIAQPTEEEIEQYYQKHINRYKVFFNATVQHITVDKRNEAQIVVEEAKKPGADFNELYEKYSKGKDRQQGILKQAPYGQLVMSMGGDAVEAIKKAQSGDVLGPLMGVKGFEVILVDAVTLARTQTLAEVRGRVVTNIMVRVREKHKKDVRERIMAAAQSKIVKSEELAALEKKIQDAKDARAAKKAEEAKKAQEVGAEGAK